MMIFCTLRSSPADSSQLAEVPECTPTHKIVSPAILFRIETKRNRARVFDPGFHTVFDDRGDPPLVAEALRLRYQRQIVCVLEVAPVHVFEKGNPL